MWREYLTDVRLHRWKCSQSATQSIPVGITELNNGPDIATRLPCTVGNCHGRMPLPYGGQGNSRYSLLHVPGIYIAPWYSVTSGKTEIGSDSVALPKRWWDLVGAWIIYSIVHFYRPYKIRSLQKCGVSAKESLHCIKKIYRLYVLLIIFIISRFTKELANFCRMWSHLLLFTENKFDNDNQA